MILAIAFSAIALACYIILGVVTIRQRARGRTNRAFVLYLAAMAFWQFTALMVSFSKSAASALLWYKLMTAGLAGQFILYLLFTLVFLGLERRRGWFYAGWLIFVALLASSGTNLVIEGVSKSEVTGLYVPHFGLLVPAVGIITYTFLGYGTYCLIRGYRRTTSGRQRDRIRYLLLGAGAIAIGSLSNLVPALQAYPVDVAANVVNALLIAYAILRYQLLDITLVVRKGLLYSIPTAIIGTGYFLIIFVAVRLFHAFTGPQIFLLSLFVAAVTAMVAQPLRERAQIRVDRLFFREKYDAYLMLQKLSREVASVIQLEALLNMIFEELAARMHIARVGVFLKEAAGDFRLVAQKGLDEDLAHLNLRKDHPLVNWLAREGDVLTRHEIGMHPHFKALWGEEREDLERLGAELFISLKAKGERVGILAVGPRLSEVVYSQDDQLILITLANQVAIAIENARLYDAVQRELAERVRAEETLQGYSERLEEMVEQRTLELRKAYSDLRDSQLKLIQSEKLAATGRLAASVAHEINNPLQGISNYLSVISRQVSEGNPLHEDLDMVKLGFERIAEIVRRLRAFYRPAGEGMEPTDINGVVERVLALVGHQLSLGQVEVKTELAEQELPVLGSAGQLEQVLVNLALNAQEAMPQGGELMVRTTLRDDVVQLQVSDTGQGIGEEEMSRLFKPFYSERGDKGLGLGLWISHNIIEGHGGSIEVESQMGQGTTFTISLPEYQRER